MNFKARLSQRIGMDDINEILRLTHDSDSRKQELYNLVIGEDEIIGYHAAWIFTHFTSQDNEWLYNKQDQLIDEVLACKHGGKRRVILNLLYRQLFPNPPRVDFLDFCLERMMSSEELPGVKSLCMKIAYELCRPIPELIQELKTMLEMMDGDLSPAIYSVRKNILKAMQKGKSLQKL
ncbi:MAG: hypothetical protein KH100_09760 [Dysgonomonas mossii]|uniref:hypothetical protein n=1 Tax=Dysgonomonas mossii TaxID=163665 RepID=UPI001DD7DA8C|nr:hypothetical protein [Dysgonomonas mossii]MBS5797590.1 hypothetical protein [Dysgonomonas mossii]MBS7111469.1 hypothetical protein [Dysgonomonas mossii]